MVEQTWTKVALLSDFPVNTSREVIVSDQIVALFRTADGVFALQGICPHHGGPLGKGSLAGCVVRCPWHGWQFDVRDGTYQSSQQLKHPTFPIRIEGDEVFVSV